MEVSNLNNNNEIDVHGTVHSKSDDGEVDMMDKDQSLCERDIITSANLRQGMFTQVRECVKKYTQDIDIPVHASLFTR